MRRSNSFEDSRVILFHGMALGELLPDGRNQAADGHKLFASKATTRLPVASAQDMQRGSVEELVMRQAAQAEGAGHQRELVGAFAFSVARHHRAARWHLRDFRRGWD